VRKGRPKEGDEALDAILHGGPLSRALHSRMCATKSGEQPSGIIDETNCESCKVSSFGESGSKEGRNPGLTKDAKQMYMHII